MEYVEGAPIKGPLPPDEVVKLALQVTGALAAAHAVGIIHRDLKPDNIMVGATGVKLLDFGLAKQTMSGKDETQTSAGTIAGTASYMSPEQARGDTLDQRSDIFSLGAVLYELLAGKHPFHGESLPGIIQKITETPHLPVAELRSDVPPVLGHIVDRCLIKEPAQRYKTGLDLAADLSLVFAHIKLLDDEIPTDDKFAMVKDLQFFQSFSEPEIWEVINAGAWHEYDPGAEIISEGEIDNSFYVVVAGDVEVRKGEQALDVLSKGDCFGEMGFIAGRQRTASIIARSPVTTLKVRASLIERASLHCQLRFHKVFLNTLVARLSLASEKVSGRST
jgi:serine/threonine protein kinase